MCLIVHPWGLNNLYQIAMGFSCLWITIRTFQLDFVSLVSLSSDPSYVTPLKWVFEYIFTQSKLTSFSMLLWPHHCIHLMSLVMCPVMWDFLIVPEQARIFCSFRVAQAIVLTAGLPLYCQFPTSTPRWNYLLFSLWNWVLDFSDSFTDFNASVFKYYNDFNAVLPH